MENSHFAVGLVLVRQQHHNNDLILMQLRLSRTKMQRINRGRAFSGIVPQDYCYKAKQIKNVSVAFICYSRLILVGTAWLA